MLVEGERWVRSLGDGLGKPDIAAGMFALFLFPPSYFYISFPSFPLLLLFTYIWWKLQHGISQVLTSLTDDRRMTKKRAISPTTQYRSGIQLNSRLDRSTTTPTTTSSLLHAHFQKESKSTSPTPAKLENSTTLAPLLPLPAQNSPWPTYLLPTSLLPPFLPPSYLPPTSLLPPSYLPPTSLLPPSPTLLTPSTVRLRKLHPLSWSPLQSYQAHYVSTSPSPNLH